jgi:hypothetical protein
MKRLYSCEQDKEIKLIVCTQIINQCNDLKTECMYCWLTVFYIEYSSFLGCDTVTLVVPHVSKDQCLHFHGRAAPPPPPRKKSHDLSKHQEPLA